MRRWIGLLVMLLGLVLIIPASAQEMPDFSQLAAGEWSQIDVEGGVCLYGADYSFFVRPNEEPTDKLMIYFQGGGACWDGVTCGSIGEFASYYDVSPTLMDFYDSGIFDYDNPSNPLADYHMVFLPYCSGDIFTGDKTITFDLPDDFSDELDEIEVFFKGAANAQKVLEWVYDNFTQPEHIVVSGCSAGGYGATAHAPFIMGNYADVPATLFVDSAHGVLERDWNGLQTWGTLDLLPEFIPDLATVLTDDYDTTYHIISLAEYFPENQFAQFNSYVDGVQIGFYAATQGQALDFENNAAAIAGQWSGALIRNTQRMSALDNYSYYTAGGFEHCLDYKDIFYEYDQSGIIFADWFTGMLEGQAENITCNVLSGGCFEPPVEIVDVSD